MKREASLLFANCHYYLYQPVALCCDVVIAVFSFHPELSSFYYEQLEKNVPFVFSINFSPTMGSKNGIHKDRRLQHAICTVRIVK